MDTILCSRKLSQQVLRVEHKRTNLLLRTVSPLPLTPPPLDNIHHTHHHYQEHCPRWSVKKLKQCTSKSQRAVMETLVMAPALIGLTHYHHIIYTLPPMQPSFWSQLLGQSNVGIGGCQKDPRRPKPITHISTPDWMGNSIS